MPAECTLVFPKLKGRVSDSGCRSAVSKKTAGTPLHSPRPPSNLGAHMQVHTPRFNACLSCGVIHVVQGLTCLCYPNGNAEQARASSQLCVYRCVTSCLALQGDARSRCTETSQSAARSSSAAYSPRPRYTSQQRHLWAGRGSPCIWPPERGVQNLYKMNT